MMIIVVIFMMLNDRYMMDVDIEKDTWNVNDCECWLMMMMMVNDG